MKFLRMWAVPAHALSSHGRAAVSGYMARSAMRLHSKKPDKVRTSQSVPYPAPHFH